MRFGVKEENGDQEDCPQGWREKIRRTAEENVQKDRSPRRGWVKAEMAETLFKGRRKSQEKNAECTADSGAKRFMSSSGLQVGLVCSHPTNRKAKVTPRRRSFLKDVLNATVPSLEEN